MQKAWRSQLHNFLKTESGSREVDLCPALAAMLKEYPDNRPKTLKSDLLFQSRSGKPLQQSNILRRTLHPILENFNEPKCGCHAFRRFRVTHRPKRPKLDRMDRKLKPSRFLKWLHVLDSREISGAPGETRTPDPLLRSRLSTFIKTCRSERKAGENQQVVTTSDQLFAPSSSPLSRHFAPICHN